MQAINGVMCSQFIYETAQMDLHNGSEYWAQEVREW